MGLRHVYVQDILNITMVVVLQIIFLYMDLFIEMGPPMSKSQVNESQSRTAPPILVQTGVSASHSILGTILERV